MERREFLKNSTTFISGFPLIQTAFLDFSKKVFSVADGDIASMKVGKIQCTVFRD